MPGYDALKDVLGKTIKGVIVKKNVTGTTPAVSIHFVFTDDTSYEIYSLYQMSFAKGLNDWGMEEARKYGNPTMENVFDLYVDEELSYGYPARRPTGEGQRALDELYKDGRKPTLKELLEVTRKYDLKIVNVKFSSEEEEEEENSEDGS